VIFDWVGEVGRVDVWIIHGCEVDKSFGACRQVSDRSAGKSVMLFDPGTTLRRHQVTPHGFGHPTSLLSRPVEAPYRSSADRGGRDALAPRRASIMAAIGLGRLSGTHNVPMRIHAAREGQVRSMRQIYQFRSSRTPRSGSCEESRWYPHVQLGSQRPTYKGDNNGQATQTWLAISDRTHP